MTGRREGKLLIFTWGGGFNRK